MQWPIDNNTIDIEMIMLNYIQIYPAQNVFSVATFVILPSCHIVLHCNGVSRIIKIIESKF